MQLIPGPPAEVGMSSKRIDRIVEESEEWIAQGVTPSLVVLAARRGKIVLHKAFGQLTDQPDSPPLVQDSIFPLASLTKPVTATAAMILVEDGRLSLNRPASEYVPEFAGEGKDAIMVHHLLTHTSGLTDETVNEYYQKSRVKAKQEQHSEESQHPKLHHYLTAVYNGPLHQPPGLEMSYSNCGYELLGEIVRRVCGPSLAEFAYKRIFEPLGMKDTFYVVPDAVKDRIVKRFPKAPYAESESPAIVDFPEHFRSWFTGLNSEELGEIPSAIGGLFSAAPDMAIFGQMFLNGGIYDNVRILSPVTVAEMARNQIPGIPARFGDEVFPEAGWGFGWDIHGNKKGLYDGSLQSPQAFGHGGAGGVHLWVDPAYDIVGVYFSVAPDLTAIGAPREQPDLFMNMVTAAITEI